MRVGVRHWKRRNFSHIISLFSDRFSVSLSISISPCVAMFHPHMFLHTDRPNLAPARVNGRGDKQAHRGDSCHHLEHGHCGQTALCCLGQTDLSCPTSRALHASVAVPAETAAGQHHDRSCNSKKRVDRGCSHSAPACPICPVCPRVAAAPLAAAAAAAAAVWWTFLRISRRRPVQF